MNLTDRPRERLARLGAGALSDAELLSLILRTGSRDESAARVAEGLLVAFRGLRAVCEAPLRSLELRPGLGPAKAASISAVAELARRLESPPLERGVAIDGPEAVQRHFAARLRASRRESFFVLLLDGRHRLIAEEEVSRGTLTASLVHPREVFRDAIRAAAAALILVHNHPSGDPRPSAEDHAVTRRLYDAGRLLGIEVLDHVIVSAGGHWSFQEAGEPLASGVASGEGAAAPRSRAAAAERVAPSPAPPHAPLVAPGRAAGPPRELVRVARGGSTPERDDRAPKDCEPRG